MQLNNARFLTIPILLALLFSALTATTALADDSVPPPADPAATETQPTTDILTQVPELTNVVVVNSEGDVLPLATEEATQAIVDGDPMWCPAGIAPKENTGGCSVSYSFIGGSGEGGLYDWLATNDPSKAGVIWVEYNYDSDANEPTYNAITLDGGSFAHLDNFAITVQGGWSGTPGSKLLNTAQPYSLFTTQLHITNWTGAVTLNNINITLIGVDISADDSALNVTTAGTITLDTVNVRNNSDSVASNTMNGADLNNTASTSGATVTIKNSSFDENQGSGLFVLSNGIITANNINANGNGGGGVGLNNSGATTAKSVTITGFQQFNNNGDNGLSINSTGLITVANIVANNNAHNGASFYNSTDTGYLGVIIKGTSQFNNNNYTGLNIQSQGVITLNSITANNNGGYGAYLFNAAGGGAPPKAVTLTGTNIFNGNGTSNPAYGLSVSSLGAITVNNITASNNNTGGDDGGIELNNNLTGAVGGITINGYGTFEHNSKYGLKATSLGIILLNNINANNNGTGAFISNCANPGFPNFYTATCDATPAKAITFKGTNNFNGNSGYGLEALSNSTITASSLTASGNGSSTNYSTGITIGNAYLAGIGGITLTGSNTFNNNTNSAGRGVVFYSTKAITISNLTANGNAGYGALITNQFAPTIPGNVTLSGTSQFNGNGNTGLNVYTFGTILLNNITANYNTGSGNGIYVDNSMGLPKAITLTGFNNFSNNAGSGLNLNSLGVITLNNITANNNLGAGAYLHNDGMMAVATATSPGITIKGNNSFSNNAYGGIEMYSYGVITLNNINANNNAWVGARVNNVNALLKAVTFTGVNNFNGNGFGGLVVDSKGVVTLTRVTANGNDPTNAQNGSGVYVDHAKSITLTCGFAYNNGTYGFYLHTANSGLVTVKGVYSFSNGTNYDIPAPNTITYPCTLP